METLIKLSDFTKKESGLVRELDVIGLLTAVNKAQRQIVYSELCPNCGLENEYSNRRMVQKCHHCGARVIMCSLCPRDNCNNCEYEKENGNDN